MEHQMMLPEIQQFVRAKDLKLVFGIKSDATLWRWVKSGKLPAPKYLNGCRVWGVDDVNGAILKLLSSEAPITPMSNTGGE